jgi:hypothetical protein
MITSNESRVNFMHTVSMPLQHSEVVERRHSFSIHTAGIAGGAALPGLLYLTIPHPWHVMITPFNV